MILPGSTIGILGGGQLGKMAAIAAANLGYRTHIYCPSDDSPAFHVSDRKTQASYTDPNALREFAKSVDVVTFEFENIPHTTVQILEELVLVRPNWPALFTSQNRLREKRFAAQLGVGVTPFEEIHTLTDLQMAMRRLQTDCLLKTVEFGYDGKGQCWIDCNSNLEAIWETFDSECGILEAFVPFAKEVSAIVARGPDGQSKAFPITENRHKNGILDESFAPAKIDAAIAQEAGAIATLMAEKLDLVGLLAVEFFLTHEGHLLFNEMAPRPHNSGHWTMDGCYISQFEQFIRAVCGLPLLEAKQHSAVRMKNLIGDEVKQWQHHAAEHNVKIHLYGKREIKAGRKLGHMNFVSPLNVTQTCFQP